MDDEPGDSDLRAESPGIHSDQRCEVIVMFNRRRICPGFLSILLAACWVFSAPSAQAQQLLPNLQVLPAQDIAVVENFGGVVELRFGTNTYNTGIGPLELIAGGVSKAQQFVYQRVYETGGSYQDHLAGRFVWHQGHSHFHLDDYARYTLQSVQGKSKRSSSKTSFCLMDIELVDGQLPGAPKNAVYIQCGNFFQGVSVGWADVYGSHLPGQEIDLTRLKDGDYRLMIEVDPKNHLLETNENDNTSCVLLRIGVAAKSVDVLDPNGCDDGTDPPPAGDVTVESITPNSASVDQVVNVLINGTGFSEGVSVNFDNGRGSRPVASNVVVVSSTEITAIVTIKRRGGSAADNVWDLVVGSGVLQDAFTVLP